MLLKIASKGFVHTPKPPKGFVHTNYLRHLYIQRKLLGNTRFKTEQARTLCVQKKLTNANAKKIYSVCTKC